MFRRLCDNLVVPEKDDFMWDEDPEVRDMLCRVFAEDDGPSIDIDGLEVVSDVRVQEGVQDKSALAVATSDCAFDMFVGICDGNVVGVGSVVHEENAVGVVSVGVVHDDGDIGAHSADGANEECKMVGEDSERENFRSSSVGRPRKRGRPRKVKVVLSTRGYCSDTGKNVQCARRGGISGPMTRRKARSSASWNPFKVLSNEDSYLEC